MAISGQNFTRITSSWRPRSAVVSRAFTVAIFFVSSRCGIKGTKKLERAIDVFFWMRGRCVDAITALCTSPSYVASANALMLTTLGENGITANIGLMRNDHTFKRVEVGGSGCSQDQAVSYLFFVPKSETSNTLCKPPSCSEKRECLKCLLSPVSDVRYKNHIYITEICHSSFHNPFSSLPLCSISDPYRHNPIYHHAIFKATSPSSTSHK